MDYLDKAHTVTVYAYKHITWPKVLVFENQMQSFYNAVPSNIIILSPAVMEQRDPFCVEGVIVLHEKEVHSIHNIIIFGKMITTEILCHFREEVVVRVSQIRRIRWVFDKLNPHFWIAVMAPVDVCAGALSWWKKHSFCQLSTPNPLDPFSQKIGIVGSSDSVTLV